MLEKLKKKSIKKSIMPTIILLIIGLLFIGMEGSEVKSLLKGHQQFETLAPEEINDELIVDVSLDTNFGCFAEYYEENTDTHVRHTTDLYYVIWSGEEVDEDFCYLGIKIPTSDESKMDAMAVATYNYENFETVEYSGAIKKMNDEEYECFKTYFTTSGWSEAEFEEWTVPYYISVGELVGDSAAMVYVLFGIGVGLILIAIISFASALCGGGLKTFKKELKAAGFSVASAEFDYESAKVFSEKEVIRVGRKLTYLMRGRKPHAIRNDKLVWAYQHSVTHRVNGIKIVTTYDVVLYEYDKKICQIAFFKEAESLEILRYIEQNMPWVVVGYSEELSNMFRKEYQNFLDIAYNKESYENFPTISL